jgi:serine protease Do
MRLAMKNLNRTILGVMASAFLQSGFVLCNFGAQAQVPHSKIGRWSVAYLEVGNLSGCRAAAQFPDQTIFQMALMQSGTNKSWVIFISNPKWNWRSGKLPPGFEFAGQELLLVTTKPWRVTFSSSDDGKTLFTDTSVEFMNGVADAASMEIMYINKELLTAVDMKDSAAAIKAVMKCVREPHSVPSPQAEISLSGTAFFVAANLLITNDHVVRECTKTIQVRYPQEAWYTATSSGQDDKNDLVLLHTEMPNLSVASFRSQPPQLGEEVATYGFPYFGILSSNGNFTPGGYITALNGMGDDTRFLQTSTPIQPGNSGSPLLDMSGRMVGVVVHQLNAIAMMPRIKVACRISRLLVASPALFD